MTGGVLIALYREKLVRTEQHTGRNRDPSEKSLMVSGSRNHTQRAGDPGEWI